MCVCVWCERERVEGERKIGRGLSACVENREREERRERERTWGGGTCSCSGVSRSFRASQGARPLPRWAWSAELHRQPRHSAFGGRDARERVNRAAGASPTTAGGSAARGGGHSGGGHSGGRGGGLRPRRTWLSVMGKAERTRRVLKLSEGLHARSAWAGRESAGAPAEQATDADGCTALSGARAARGWGGAVFAPWCLSAGV